MERETWYALRLYRESLVVALRRRQWVHASRVIRRALQGATLVVIKSRRI